MKRIDVSRNQLLVMQDAINLLEVVLKAKVAVFCLNEQGEVGHARSTELTLEELRPVVAELMGTTAPFRLDEEGKLNDLRNLQ